MIFDSLIIFEKMGPFGLNRVAKNQTKSIGTKVCNLGCVG